MVNRYSPFDVEQMEADLGGDYVDYADYQKLETLLVDFTRAVGEALIRAKGSDMETACQHDCVQNGYPDQDCPKHGSSTGTAPSGEKHQDKPRPVTQYDGSLKDGDTIMDRKGNLWVARTPAETGAKS